jgi:hypothetical protein
MSPTKGTIERIQSQPRFPVYTTSFGRLEAHNLTMPEQLSRSLFGRNLTVAIVVLRDEQTDSKKVLRYVFSVAA